MTMVEVIHREVTTNPAASKAANGKYFKLLNALGADLEEAERSGKPPTFEAVRATLLFWSSTDH